MRDRLLMLAEIPTDAVAVDARRVLGEDHDRLLNLRSELDVFKKHQSEIADVVGKYKECQQVRGEQMYRWTILRQQKEAFDADNRQTLTKLEQEITDAETAERTSSANAKTKRGERDSLIKRGCKINRVSGQK